MMLCGMLLGDRARKRGLPGLGTRRRDGSSPREGRGALDLDSCSTTCDLGPLDFSLGNIRRDLERALVDSEKNVAGLDDLHL